jgi:ribonuclease E
MANTSEPTKEPTSVPASADDAAAQQTAEAPAKKTPAKKAPTRKPAAKKTTTKKAPAKKKPASKAADATDAAPAEQEAIVQDAAPQVDAVATDQPAEADAAPDKKTAAKKAAPKKAPVKKTTRKPAAKKSGAKKPAADADTAEASADAPASGDAPEGNGAAVEPKADSSAEPTTVSVPDTTESKQAADTTVETKRDSHPATSLFDELNSGSPFEVPSATLGLLFQAPTELPKVKFEEKQDSSGASKGTKQDSQEQTSTRRRRRRRRGDEDLEIEGGAESDPPGTITKVRAPRNGSSQANDAPVDHVVAVKGSTRLEAKRQRRRESRESGRRRHSITEAEFLARRESVDRKMVVRQNDERIQIGVMEDGVLAEHFVSHTTQDSMIGNVYLGKVQNVLPSMEAAFVDIGRGRNAVLYAGEVDWAKAKLDGKPRRIENALKSGDTVLVQVTKDPVGHKGARLTSQISLPGRYLVYVPAGSMTGISRKLPDTERARLKKVLKEHLPDKAGVIVRTAAEGASEQELMNDINRLRVQWEGIESSSTSTKIKAPELLYSEPDLMIKVVRDVFNEDFSKLVVQGEHAWDTIEAYVTYVAPDLVDRLEKWEGADDLFTHLRVDEQIGKALERTVKLPSGGSLVIDRTEAMTVIDVNTGKFTGSGGNLEETVTKNNLEAAEEIVRQMRLRDMGGIIVVDFIDMVLESNRDLVLRRLVECLGRDRTKHQVAEVTSLGLVQMTRKKIGTGLLEVFSESCEACAGRGVVIHDEPLQGHSHQQQVKSVSDRPTRSERRKQRQAQEEVKTASTPAEDPEAQERAQKARMALASIAAASGHAGEVAVDDPSSASEAVVSEGRGEHEAPSASEQGDEPSQHGHDDASGEQDEQRPRRRRRRGRRGRGGRGQSQPQGQSTEQPEGQDHGPTTQARVSDEQAPAAQQAPQAPQAPAPEASADKAKDPAQAEPLPSGIAKPRRATAESTPHSDQADEPKAIAPKKPARRRRAAASAAGTDAGVTVVNSTEPAKGSRIVSTTVASSTQERAPQAGSGPEEPVMLGVGVPASEL